jgi:tryptophanyl-tRNA synthetase
MRILSGIQSSGVLHIGNYFGMMRPAIALQAEGEAFYFIADYHALTSLKDPAALRETGRRVALDFLACGLDPERAALFLQSDVPQVTELTWILSTVTPMGLLERAHSYKDKIARGMSASAGLFTYPVLMAADILLYRTDYVPVGEDQRQHLELTRDVAQRFNSRTPHWSTSGSFLSGKRASSFTWTSMPINSVWKLPFWLMEPLPSAPRTSRISACRGRRCRRTWSRNSKRSFATSS